MYGFWGFDDWNPWIGRAEKSNKAERIEQFAKDEFDKIRRRLERTKVMNNEAIIRNGCREDSESPLRNLPEITLVHIFQFSRPAGFVAEKLADKQDETSAGGKPKPRRYDNRQNSYWYRQRIEREEAERKQRLGEEIEAADLKEMAAAAGSAAGAPDAAAASDGSDGVAKSSGAAAVSNRAKGSRTSDRKRSGESISYDENAGDNEFEKQLRAFEKQRPVPVLKGFASVEVSAGEKTAGDDGSDEEEELRPIDEVIDALYEPGFKLTLSFLSPDTHLTGPCYRDFNRYVKTFPMWCAKRIEATAEERKKYKFSKKGKAYFIKLIFTIPGKPVAKKKTAADTSKTKAVAKTKPVAKKTDVNPILAEAAALAARQMDARKAREAQEPAKKKAKTS